MRYKKYLFFIKFKNFEHILEKSFDFSEILIMILIPSLLQCKVIL